MNNFNNFKSTSTKVTTSAVAEAVAKALKEGGLKNPTSKEVTIVIEAWTKTQTGNASSQLKLACIYEAVTKAGGKSPKLASVVASLAD